MVNPIGPKALFDFSSDEDTQPVQRHGSAAAAAATSPAATSPVSTSATRALFASDDDTTPPPQRRMTLVATPSSPDHTPLATASAARSFFDSDDESTPVQQQQTAAVSGGKREAKSSHFISNNESLQPSTKRRRAGAIAPEWMKKQPWVEMGHFTINGSRLPIEKIGDGSFHKVFQFTTDVEIELGGTRVNTQDLVLKILLSGNVGPNKEEEVILDEEKGYQHLLEQGIPVPMRYADPITFQDSINSKNGKFWIIEKMPHAVTGDSWSKGESFEELNHEDKKILTWTKSILTRMATEGTDLVNDFRKRNTMLNDAGDPFVIDFSEPQHDDLNINLSSYVKDWANGNPKIEEFLTSDFPAPSEV